MKDAKLCLAAFLTALIIIGCIVYPLSTYSPPKEPEPTYTPRIDDRPLLTPEQKQEALQTDSVAFRVGNENIVIQYGAREALKDYL